MNANSFWNNYKSACEWQKRHCTVWWKTRCLVLEYENHILRRAIRKMEKIQTIDYACKPKFDQLCTNNVVESVFRKGKNDKLEFYLDENMMNFLTQSIKHKRELKNQKKDFESELIINKKSNEILEGSLTWVMQQNKDARFLYGDSSSKILAMETALKATIEKYTDNMKSYYWPNIALKL